MKKVGIVTIIDNNNYGNRLQNYAMQLLLADYGFNTETIRFSSNSFYEDVIEKMKIRMLHVPLVVSLRNFIRKDKYLCDTVTEKIKQRKIRSFKRFNKQFIIFHKRCIRVSKIHRRLNDYFDYFVVGSDQIWNPNYSFSEFVTYLRFADDNKRIAVAPSFGVDKIPIQKENCIREYLLEFRYVSVREESGRRIVESLTGNNCDVIMDPTLIVSPEVWKKLIHNVSNKLPKQYVLTYFLGKVSEARMRLIQEFARKQNMKVINMNNLDETEYYCWGPEMFVKTINDCNYFFTDSFHGCVFSIIFHKQFFVFHREDSQANMFGRIETLLDIVGLQNRIINKELLIMEDIMDSEYQKIDAILEQKRVRTKFILQDVLI